MSEAQIPTPHIGAKKRTEIAKRVLFPGDPLRGKWIAKNFLKDVRRFNRVRNMFGYTGTGPDGRRVSVMGGGMGQPGVNIYATELFVNYGVEEIIRVGSTGALQEDINLRDIIIAQASCTDSNMNRQRFNGLDYAAIPNWDLLLKAYQKAQELGIPVRVGNIFATDFFYHPTNPDWWKLWASYGVLSVEMESTELYTLAAQHKKKALTILTVSDNLATNQFLDSKARQSSFGNMVEIALTI